MTNLPGFNVYNRPSQYSETPLVYDCFMFFNELDLLEIRLNILSPLIDYFLLVESNRTFSNKPKSMYFEDNKSRFSLFLNKIIHIKITNYPEHDDEMSNPWFVESYQRNTILEGLKHCKPEDIIILSDLDEIPNPETIHLYKERKLSGIHKLRQLRFNYYINYQCILRYWYGTNILNYQDIIENNAEKYKYSYNDIVIESLNHGTTPTKIRNLSDVPVIKSGGWHFSFLGGLDNIIYKLTSFSHHEDYRREYKDEKLLYHRIKRGIDLFRPKDTRFTPVKIDKRFPEYIRANKHKYSDLIYHKISPIRNFFKIVIMYIYMYVILFPVKNFKNKFRQRNFYKKIKIFLKRQK
jgi:beta-1,4-mannosyl-glycoprotein beta-1,4-N-acetylglucosaminyltransferase